MAIKILGIDPGVSETGWAVVDGAAAGGPRLLASGCVKTTPRAALPQRLERIHGALCAVIEEHAPESAAVEEMFFTKIAHTIRATLQARGVVLLAAAQHKLPLREFNPKQVKVALTGSGSAAKAQMQKMVQATFKLAAPLRPDDVADAAAIALCGVRTAHMKTFKVLDRLGGRK